jgi:hypothetical protein
MTKSRRQNRLRVRLQELLETTRTLFLVQPRTFATEG